MPFQYDSLEERLLRNSTILPVADPDYREFNGSPCWVWIGPRNRQGYGVICMRRRSGKAKGLPRTKKAHRVALMVFKGRYLGKRYVGRHLCNNPPCINPEHLAGGTLRTNTRDMVRSGRFRHPQMSRVHRRALEDFEVLA
jgi:hypothetical protein